MSTFNAFQIGDFCQRAQVGILNFPIQAKQTSLIDILLNSPLSNAYQTVVQNGYQKRKYAISYQTRPCDEPGDVDMCDLDSAGYTPTVSNIEYTFDGAPVIKTRVIRLASQSYKEWCDLNGGSSGYLQQLQQLLVSEIQLAYERFEKSVLQAAYDNKGCYTDGTQTAKLAQLFLNASSGAPSVNPAWSFPIEQGLAELGLSTMSYYVGGGQFWQAGRILQSQYQVPNTMLGVNSQTVPNNFAFSAQMNSITTSDTYEKILVISPEAVALTTFSKVANQFANKPIDPNSELIGQLWGTAFNNAAAIQNYAFVIVDPIKGLLWDVFAKFEQCGADFTLDFQAQLTYQFHVLPMSDRICGNSCFTGIQVYNLCPLPTAEPCDAPDPVTPVTPLCLAATLPDPCTLIITAGEEVTFDVGAFTVVWVAPIAYTISSEADLFVFLTSMFGANPTAGNWNYIDGSIVYNGNGDLAAGVGTIVVTSGCFDDIAITIAECI